MSPVTSATTHCEYGPHNSKCFCCGTVSPVPNPQPRGPVTALCLSPSFYLFGLDGAVWVTAASKPSPPAQCQVDGHLVAWLKCCAASREVAGSIPDEVIEFLPFTQSYSRTVILGYLEEEVSVNKAFHVMCKKSSVTKMLTP
jgi:hypothetical protein